MTPDLPDKLIALANNAKGRLPPGNALRTPDERSISNLADAILLIAEDMKGKRDG